MNVQCGSDSVLQSFAKAMTALNMSSSLSSPWKLAMTSGEIIKADLLTTTGKVKK